MLVLAHAGVVDEDVAARVAVGDRHVVGERRRRVGGDVDAAPFDPVLGDVAGRRAAARRRDVGDVGTAVLGREDVPDLGVLGVDGAVVSDIDLVGDDVAADDPVVVAVRRLDRAVVDVADALDQRDLGLRDLERGRVAEREADPVGVDERALHQVVEQVAVDGCGAAADPDREDDLEGLRLADRVGAVIQLPGQVAAVDVGLGRARRDDRDVVGRRCDR